MPALPSPTYDRIQPHSFDNGTSNAFTSLDTSSPRLKQSEHNYCPLEILVGRCHARHRARKRVEPLLNSWPAVPLMRLRIITLQYGGVEECISPRTVNESSSQQKEEHQVLSETDAEQGGRRVHGDGGLTVVAISRHCKEPARPQKQRYRLRLTSLISSKRGSVFIKRIRRGGREDKILKLCGRYPEISRNIVTVRRLVPFDAHVLVHMEYADCDLRQLLRDNRRPKDLLGKLCVVQALAGLAEGLKFLHEGMGDKFVVHSDLREQNVLVFAHGNDRLTFKIADFGISFLGDRSFGAIGFTNPKQGSECDCRPPEGFWMIHKGIRLDAPLAYDVYGFGVLLLKSLAWLEDGPNGLEDFDEQRTQTAFWESSYNTWFFSIVRADQHSITDGLVVDSEHLHLELDTDGGPTSVVVRPNDGVHRHFRSICNAKASNGAEEYIQDAYLIAKQCCLSPDPQKRNSISTVADMLKLLVLRHRADCLARR